MDIFLICSVPDCERFSMGYKVRKGFVWEKRKMKRCYFGHF